MKITINTNDLKTFYLSKSNSKDEWLAPERDLEMAGVISLLQYLNKNKALKEIEDFIYKTKFP